ncbi:MAG: Spx/MgsR family RNA polymerase-binding regulatory protein [Elusimicrobia bacterium]|nr:Spx/MgsR family RNA polymerase-binding regulatory protein [Elusimicrobiota bacterium]
MLKVYEYEKCSTCRKALKFLEARGVRYERVPIVERPPTPGELREMLRRIGDIKRLFNTSGELYREMKLSEKLPTMKAEEALDLLSRHGKLVKRPFALGATVALLGFDEAEWKKAFK